MKKLLLFCLVSIKTFSQLPTPEARAFSKTSGSNINHSSGASNLNIPIYTIKEADLDLPIYLSYSGSGVQVEEVASRVGLGWSLVAGGSIQELFEISLMKVISLRGHQLLALVLISQAFNQLGLPHSKPVI